MRPLQKTAALLTVLGIGLLGPACDGTDTPTQASSAKPAFDGGGSDDGDGRNDRLRAVPFVFIGQAGDCGTGYPAGSRIVTAAWLGGMGLPDNGGQNVGLEPTDNPNKKDPHRGLLLSKNGTTPDCSSSGARIREVRGITLTAASQLGFDYRNGGHCGAGAPRFSVSVRNAVTNTETSHFVGGCANDPAATPAPQDPLQWTRVRFGTTNPAQTFPIIPPGSRVRSISILYDEGTDTPSPSDPNGVGLAVIDNIFIDGEFIRRGSGIADGPGGGNGGNGDNGDNGDD